MAASPQTVTSNAQYMNARTNVYTAHELRKPFEELPIGPGAKDYDSFRVRQRVAGANMSVDCTAASILNTAWVRFSTSVTAATAPADSGLYRVDYNSATIINLDIAAADPTNPRIDQVFLAVEDAQAAGANNQATIRVVTGTPTGGATLENRTGVGANPAGMGSILLADILVPAAAATVVTANIRDRRPVGVWGTVPWAGAFGTQIDMVQLTVSPLAPQQNRTSGVVDQASADQHQLWCLMYLPRRIVSATRVRWRYAQGATANAGNYNIGIYDTSGTLVISTGAVAYTGVANAIVEASATISATSFNAGWYYVAIGNSAATAASSVSSQAIPGTIGAAFGVGPQARNIMFKITSGGTTLPNSITGATDLGSVVAAATTISVPVIALSVG